MSMGPRKVPGAGASPAPVRPSVGSAAGGAAGTPSSRVPARSPFSPTGTAAPRAGAAVKPATPVRQPVGGVSTPSRAAGASGAAGLRSPPGLASPAGLRSPSSATPMRAGAAKGSSSAARVSGTPKDAPTRSGAAAATPATPAPGKGHSRKPSADNSGGADTPMWHQGEGLVAAKHRRQGSNADRLSSFEAEMRALESEDF